jgi:hypothetical protein
LFDWRSVVDGIEARAVRYEMLGNAVHAFFGVHQGPDKLLEVRRLGICGSLVGRLLPEQVTGLLSIPDHRLPLSKAYT